MAESIRFALSHITGEHSGISIDVVRDDRFVNLKLSAGETNRQGLIAICNKSTRGGGLGNQVKEVSSKAADQPAILIRSTDFPKDTRQVVAKEIAKLIAPIGKGKRVVVSDSDWRTLAAFHAFHALNGSNSAFSEWQRAEQPLSSLASIRSILSLDELLKESIGPTLSPVAPPVVPPPPPSPDPVTPPVTPPVSGNSRIQLGVTRGSLPTPVEMNINDYCRHAGFLGGPGSGKTTAALLVIEQLLMAGVAVILIDRKGDLCRYADPQAWDSNSHTNPEQLQLLKETMEAVVYTPGIDSGRPLRIPVVPDLAGLSSADRELLAQNAAASLSQMLGYNQKVADPKLVILQKGIELLGRTGNAPVTVKALQKLITDMDESLANELEGFDAKHFNKLGQDLLVLSISQRRLLEGGEEINVDALLGRDSSVTTGRTRLSIINTQFLGDDKTVDFWLAQFLLCVDRWRSRSPSDSLQAVLFFDEADKYLPATGVRPATKIPMEGLLKRARSAGLGIFLATQSPGDLDYRCRDQVLNWFIGRVKETRAIEKLKPMFERKPDAAYKLADQTAGEFYLVRESALNAIKVTRNLLETKQLPEDRILELSLG